MDLRIRFPRLAKVRRKCPESTGTRQRSAHPSALLGEPCELEFPPQGCRRALAIFRNRLDSEFVNCRIEALSIAGVNVHSPTARELDRHGAVSPHGDHQCCILFGIIRSEIAQDKSSQICNIRRMLRRSFRARELAFSPFFRQLHLQANVGEHWRGLMPVNCICLPCPRSIPCPPSDQRVLCSRGEARSEARTLTRGKH